MDLPTFYVRHYAPAFLADARPRTHKAYAEALRLWSQFSDAELEAISTATLADFKAHLARRPGRNGPCSPATVNKHLRHVQAVLNKAGPAGPGNRDALGLLPTIPWTKPLRAPLRAPRHIPPDELARIYHACRHAKHPRLPHTSAKNWWQALVVVLYNTASRKGAVLALEDRHIDWHHATATFAAETDKAGKPRTKPLNDCTMRHLMRLRGRTELFAWPASETTFYRQWRHLIEAAELPRYYTPHDLKRTAATTMLDLAPRDVVARMTDHASLEVLERHYHDVEHKLRPLVERLPQPWPDQPEPQRRHA